MPPKCWAPEGYNLSNTSRNTTLEGDDQHRDHQTNEDRDLNDDMDKDNFSNTNQEDDIHRMIQDTFSPMDEDNQDDSHDVDPLLEKSC